MKARTDFSSIVNFTHNQLAKLGSFDDNRPVVVAGSRAITKGLGKDWGISLYTPVIVKYRDSKTDTKIQLEDLLRGTRFSLSP